MNTKRIKDEFRIQLESVKIRKNWTDTELAKYLGVSRQTICNMRSDPFAARGQYILTVQELAREAEK